jgi:hypothetical protein
MSDTPLRHDPTDSQTDADALGPDEDVIELAAILVPYDDDPDELTIFPINAEDDDLLTTWVSAYEGSYVSLEEMR